ncbi:MAG: IclR family transcriptional regulator C-terminal domain-containing protein [Lentisphaeria bacterium]
MIKVIPKIVKILELATKQGELSFTELLAGTGLGRSNLSHLLKSLCENGLLCRKGHGRYAPGEKLFLLLRSSDKETALYQIVNRCANNVMYEFNELTVVTACHGGQRLTLVKVRPQGKSHQVNGSGERYQRASWYNTASGRVLLAFQSEEQIRQLVNEYGLPLKSEWPTALTFESLLAEIAFIRQQQTVVFEVDEYVTSIAVPVPDASGELTLCVSMAFLRALRKFSDQEIIERLRKHAEVMAKEIHFNGIIVSKLHLS